MRSLLRPFAADTGIALVLMIYMPRGQDSALGEIIARYTRMPVRVAADGEPVEPNHVYVCPPDHLLTVVADRLRLERDAVAHHKPIDVFLGSLAHARRCGVASSCRAAAATARSASRRIKERGGLTVAQTRRRGPRQTRHAGAAIAGGVVDLVFRSRDGGQGRRIFPRLRSSRLSGGRGRSLSERAVPEASTRSTHLLRNQVGHDFSGYKTKTFLRRVQRRMQVLQLDAIADYVERLRQDPREVKALFRDLLINVTNFFRDARSV